jgi:hypothetical protein
MSKFGFFSVAPDGWEARCATRGALFGCPEWQGLLEASFGCRSIYGWNGEAGAAISAFKAGPFTVGYLGFPAGGFIGDPEAHDQMLTELGAGASVGLTCLRVPVSLFGTDLELRAPYVTNPETAIADLQSWDLMAVSKNLRRDIRKAERSGLEVDLSTDEAIGTDLFGMYEDAVRHHGGSLRYNRDYFRGLLAMSARNSAIRVYIARHDGSIAGFAVVVLHGHSACYLHGGSAAEFRSLSPSDLILANAITSARADGKSLFNFMASPADQPTLVRYKEKWGGETRPLRTYTIRLSAAFPLFRVIESLYRRIR